MDNNQASGARRYRQLQLPFLVWEKSKTSWEIFKGGRFSILYLKLIELIYLGAIQEFGNQSECKMIMDWRFSVTFETFQNCQPVVNPRSCSFV